MHVWFLNATKQECISNLRPTINLYLWLINQLRTSKLINLATAYIQCKRLKVGHGVETLLVKVIHIRVQAEALQPAESKWKHQFISYHRT